MIASFWEEGIGCFVCLMKGESFGTVNWFVGKMF